MTETHAATGPHLRAVPQPGLGVLAACLVRSYVVAAAFNARGMQSIGLTYALEPALKAIHTDPKALAAARKRYLVHYNTHLFFTPLLMGICVFMELKIARGELQADALESVKRTTMYSLSAIGDSVVGGGVLVLWALCTACLVAAGSAAWAVAMGLTLFAGLQVFKAVSFAWGVSRGFSVLPRLKRLNLINWGRRIKMVNAGLMVALWYLIWPKPVEPLPWLAGVCALWPAAYVCKDGQVPRGLALLALLAVYSLVVWQLVGM